jgi:hypothetical protein
MAGIVIDIKNLVSRLIEWQAIGFTGIRHSVPLALVAS